MAFLDSSCTEKGSSWATPKVKKKIFLAEIKKQIISFQKVFILSKYHMFWLNYESFSILSDVFCQKVSFPAKTAVLTVWQFFLWIPPRVSGLWPPLFWKCIDIIAFYRLFLYITSLIGMLQALFLQEFKVHRFMDVCDKFLY